METFKDTVAVVTGGGSGIGRALTLALARAGSRVVVADVDEGAMAAVAGEVTALGGEALTVRTDVSDLGQVQALADRAWKTFGAVHVLCNNAGVAAWGGLEQATHRDWQWVLGVNLWGVIHGVETFVPRMIAGGERGHVVNTASMAGLIASQGLGVYNTSKYAVVGLSETLAKDLKPYGIGVSVLCPGFVQTRIHESERNRPGGAAVDANTLGMLGQLVAGGIEPAAVAEKVVDAVRSDRFYILTHPEMKHLIELRTRAILDEAPPG